MIVPGTLGPPQFDNVGVSPRQVLDWRAIDLSLTPRTGQAPTFTRASPGTILDSNGRVIAAANHQPRFVDMYGTAALLLERSGTNSCLQSQTLATAPWSSVGSAGITVTNAAALAPDRTTTATSLVPAAASGTHALGQGITITATEFIAVQAFVKANGYNACIIRFGDSGSTNGFNVDFDMSTGLFGSTHGGFGSGTMNGFTSVALADGWYQILMWGKVGGAVTAGQVFIYAYDTIANANAGNVFTGNGTSGILAWGFQVERNGVTIHQPPSSYIPTTNATVTRSADSLVWPAAAVPQRMWVYEKYIELGMFSSAENNFPGFWCFGNVAGNNGVWEAVMSGTLIFMERFNNAGTSVQDGGLAPTPPARGDTVELLGILNADGSVQQRLAINGASELGSAPSGTLPFDTTWGGPTMAPANRRGSIPGYLGLVAMKAVLGPAPANMAAARLG